MSFTHLVWTSHNCLMAIGLQSVKDDDSNLLKHRKRLKSVTAEAHVAINQMSNAHDRREDDVSTEGGATQHQMQMPPLSFPAMVLFAPSDTPTFYFDPINGACLRGRPDVVSPTTNCKEGTARNLHPRGDGQTPKNFTVQTTTNLQQIGRVLFDCNSQLQLHEVQGS